MKYEIPKTFMGRPVDGAIERVLAKDKKEQKQAQIEPKQIALSKPIKANIKNPEAYIVLQGRTYGGQNGYQNLLVSKERFYQDNTWDDAHKELQKEGFQMLTIRQFADFLNLLKSGNAYDGNSNKVPKQELATLFNDITEARDPWRAEWLDAYFEKRNDGKFYVLTENKSKAEPLNQNCLMQDKTPGIDLEFWLKNANEQGLPTNKTPKGELYYWHPCSGTVARFYAYSVRSVLNCGSYPQFSNSALGVRKVAPIAPLSAVKKI